MAGQTGKVKKGGIPDREAAAKIVLQGWNSGKIKFYTHPPEVIYFLSYVCIWTFNVLGVKYIHQIIT